MKNRLLGLTLAQIENIVTANGMPKFTAKQIAQWIYQKRVSTIGEMTNISKRNREILEETCEVGRWSPETQVSSVDGTRKFLFKTESGQYVETVYIPDGERATLCVSSQVGCKMNCLFCQTGKQGFVESITAGDILNQIYSIPDAETLTNIVFMGQGEPFDNLDNVLRATEILTAGYALAWSPKRITVSTVGLKKNLHRFLEESECHLAVSMHSPLHEQRLRLMPAEKQYTIEDIVAFLNQYDFTHQRRLSFEYIMFKGVNDTISHAKEIVKLVRGLECRLNLIRFHKIPDIDLEPSSMEHIVAFRDYLTEHGVFTTIRASRGEDIWAACGLLNTQAQQNGLIRK